MKFVGTTEEETWQLTARTKFTLTLLRGPVTQGCPLLRTPYRETWEDVDIGLVGVPFDGRVTNRTGAHHGPREIRNQSSLIRKMNQSRT